MDQPHSGSFLSRVITLQNLHFWVPHQQNRKKWRARLLFIGQSLVEIDFHSPFCPLANRLCNSLFFITPPQQPNSLNKRSTTKTTTIKQKHVFNVGTILKSQVLFVTTNKEIGEYISRKYDDAGEFCNAFIDLRYAEALIEPDRPTSTNQFTILIWTEEMMEYRNKLRNCKKNEEKAFSVLLGQCSSTVVQRIEASPRWSNVSGANDPRAYPRDHVHCHHLVQRHHRTH